jgi:hypothetical protein
MVSGVKEWFPGLNLKGFCHSPESWKELWDEIVFEKGTVSVEVGAKLIDRGPGKRTDDGIIWMSWSVTRL